MQTLHLGVIDVPYSAPGPKKARKVKGKLKSGTALTTGDVATILEAKYHVAEVFYEVKKKQIAKELESSVVEALEAVLGGSPATLDPFGKATSRIDTMFKDWLSNRGMDSTGYPGVPTAAAQKGVNHRLLHPFAKGNPSRPSFIDTGQYQAHFKSWID